MLDIKKLLAEFRPEHIEARKKRNRPGGYSILEASPEAADFAEYFELGAPNASKACGVVINTKLFTEIGAAALLFSSPSKSVFAGFPSRRSGFASGRKPGSGRSSCSR